MKNEKTSKKPEPVKLDMTHLDPAMPPAELSYREPTGRDYRIIGNHRNTNEEYTFWLCVTCCEVNGDLQDEQWWNDLPVTKLAVAIDFVVSKLPQVKGEKTNPLG